METADVVGDVELLRGPGVLGAAGVDVGAALDVVESGEEEMVLGDVDFLGELCAVGVKKMRGFEMSGVFFQSFEIDARRWSLVEGLVRPSGFQSSLSLTMIWPSSMPSISDLTGRAIFLGPSGV